MRIIAPVLAVFLCLNGCSTTTTLGDAARDTPNSPEPHQLVNSETSLVRAQSALDRVSETIALLEAAVLLAENETQRARAQATLRMAHGYRGTAERAVTRAYESMLRARKSEQQRNSAGWLYRGTHERQRDATRSSAQSAADDAVKAADRAEDLAGANISEQTTPSNPVTSDPP